jgi:hypothetical protein
MVAPAEASVMSALVECAFELGKVLLKLEWSKFESEDVMAAQGGAASERILLQKIGKFWNQQNIFDRPDGLVVVTTHRLAFLPKLKSVTVTTDFLSFPFADMSNLRTTRVMGVSPAVRFDAGGKHFVFTLFSGADDVIGAILQQRRAA